jgi:uncharacterized membrane protein (UPF0127 family)
MTTTKRAWILGGVIVLLAISIKFFPYHCNCSAPTASTPNAGLKTETIMLGATPIKVEVADTDASRTQGLSDRTSLASGSGMLFVFDPPQSPGFWMKDMNFSLDMVWVGVDNSIIKIDKDVAPSTYPNAFFPPSPVKFVLELPAGFSDAQSIKVGENFSLGQ